MLHSIHRWSSDHAKVDADGIIVAKALPSSNNHSVVTYRGQTWQHGSKSVLIDMLVLAFISLPRIQVW